MGNKIILLLVCVSLLFGCSKKEDDNTITFWIQMYGTNPAEQERTLKEIIQKFYDDTGIEVSYSLVNWGQALAKYTLACTGGEAPDVGDMFFIPAMVAMGRDKYGPMLLDDVVADMGGEDTWYLNGKFDGTYDGKWYSIPWRMDVRVLML